MFWKLIRIDTMSKLASKNPIEELYRYSKELVAFLDKHEGFDLRFFVEGYFAKTLVVAAASMFEEHMKKAVLELAEQCLATNHPLVTFIKKKAVERQYHGWFEWGNKNANSFFNLFGEHFKEYAKQTMKDDERLRSSMQRFLELGHYRNRLVHEDFVTFSMNNSLDEVYQLYEDASKFVEWFQQAARNGLQVP